MVKTAANPGGLPEGPFYGFNRPSVKASEAIIQNWWRQGMMGGAKAHYDGIVAHGMPTTQADTINADLLAFIKG
jgi:hypothetical protein